MGTLRRSALLAIPALLLGVLLLGTRCQISLPPGAGFRWSPYGPGPNDPGPAWWADMAAEMASRLQASVPRGVVPQGVWVACEVRFDTGGCQLDFDGQAEDPLIAFTGNAADPTETALGVFDAEGVQVWLQVEPGFASVDELLDILLARYAHHPSVVGFGVDVEWHQNAMDPAFGVPVTDAQARAWVAAARAHRPGLRVFLKHWLPGHMPASEREGLVFIDDSQGFGSLDELAAEFAAWGAAFAPARVSFQYGYPADETWWSALVDPPGEIGARLYADVPNAEGMYWVDFTAAQVFE